MYSLLATVLPLFTLVSAFPLGSQVKRDVWTPPITYPASNTVWVAGCTYSVTWNATNPPSQITNPIGAVYLRHFDIGTGQITLAQGFNLTTGTVDVTIPANTEPDNDYVVVLFGDSGDWSPEFTIVAPESS